MANVCSGCALSASGFLYPGQLRRLVNHIAIRSHKDTCLLFLLWVWQTHFQFLWLKVKSTCRPQCRQIFYCQQSKSKHMSVCVFIAFWWGTAIVVVLHRCSGLVCHHREYATCLLKTGQWCHSWEYSEHACEHTHTHTQLLRMLLYFICPKISTLSFYTPLLILTWNRTLLPTATYPSTTSWWPLCHLKKSRLVAPPGRHALWSLMRSLLTNRQCLPECKVAYSRKGSSSELTDT